MGARTANASRPRGDDDDSSTSSGERTRLLRSIQDRQAKYASINSTQGGTSSQQQHVLASPGSSVSSRGSAHPIAIGGGTVAPPVWSEYQVDAFGQQLGHVDSGLSPLDVQAARRRAESAHDDHATVARAMMVPRVALPSPTMLVSKREELRTM
eukprot:Amastigsp_a510428_10.p1 type:complete len:154 gc:universal Amastigsp_a510428_10:1-462(+)